VKTTFPDKSNGNAKANPALCTSICCVKDKKEEKKRGLQRILMQL
jgi:hypothetical protein